MAIQFHPHVGQILRCDYATGFIVPEMVKIRPVVILSPRFSQRHDLCTIVPLSTTAPMPEMPYHCKVKLPGLLPGNLKEEAWVKADMIATISLKRLDFYHFDRDRRTGKRVYYKEELDKTQMQQIYRCVGSALGFNLI